MPTDAGAKSIAFSEDELGTVETVEVMTVPTSQSLQGLLAAFMEGHKRREFVSGWRISWLKRLECVI